MHRILPYWRHLTLLALLLALISCAPSNSKAPAVQVHIVAINDLHGYLQANPWVYRDASGANHTLDAGGLATLGGMLDQLRAADPQLLFVGAGDLVGASPAISAMWADEPTLLALHDMGLRLSAVGNHELDNGKAELLRLRDGGCSSSRPAKACRFHTDYPGSGFPYIAANLIDTQTGKPLLPAYRIEQSHGIKVAFVGAVLRDVAQVVSVRGMQGLKAVDEAESINRVIPELKAQGVDAIIALIHQGGETPEAVDQQDCKQLSGSIVEVTRRLDRAVDAVISAHTHRGYLCRVDGRLVTQGSSYGHLLTQLTLTVTPGQHQVTSVSAVNLLADPARYPPDEKLAAFEQQVQTRSNAVLLQPAGRIAAPMISNRPDPSGESALGDLIADSHLAMTRDLGAQIALMNPGGIRNNLALAPGQDQLTYAQLAQVQPFGNTLVLVDLTGAQLLALLDQQWNGDQFKPLQVSKGLSYRWDAQRPADSRVVPGSLTYNGVPVAAERVYRVVANSFLAEGGDHFTVFQQGTRRQDSGLGDLDATVAYLQGNTRRGIAVGASESAGRYQRVN
ncbi:bifunctional metallophosphatase/5'-nucleotidase [Pseudomonas sp. HR96]|uniref:bifunctional metallophosphatase/5'-nucleotidase n=1 Tax=Pseudomonas sp. HR96 TaxID=1027966 RepID=UPI002A75E68B|nr:bifunctional metallophosphatase/5'-nucleotidase [Pseudomonas sp. HR96]WPP00936.1 bifunctional metallophosphatase/5'-nucleotidase [Pseudomonas sp. HR96]